MAESKFLKWQDNDNDGIVDICDDVADVKEDKCLDCSPNPAAIRVEWKKRTIDMSMPEISTAIGVVITLTFFNIK